MCRTTRSTFRSPRRSWPWPHALNGAVNRAAHPNPSTNQHPTSTQQAWALSESRACACGDRAAEKCVRNGQPRCGSCLTRQPVFGETGTTLDSKLQSVCDGTWALKRASLWGRYAARFAGVTVKIKTKSRIPVLFGGFQAAIMERQGRVDTGRVPEAPRRPRTDLAERGGNGLGRPLSRWTRAAVHGNGVQHATWAED